MEVCGAPAVKEAEMRQVGSEVWKDNQITTVNREYWRLFVEHYKKKLECPS
jgi:hypothetical protein